MEVAVECTHCGVLMTSWASPGSPIRYYQCPICARTQSSAYREVFRHGAGARLTGYRPAPPPHGIPEATREEIHWAGIKQRAARWFARLDAEERRVPSASTPIPVLDPRHVVEIAPPAGRWKRKH